MPVLMCLKTSILVSGTGMFKALVLGKEVPALMHLRVSSVRVSKTLEKLVPGWTKAL